MENPISNPKSARRLIKAVRDLKAGRGRVRALKRLPKNTQDRFPSSGNDFGVTKSSAK